MIDRFQLTEGTRNNLSSTHVKRFIEVYAKKAPHLNSQIVSVYVKKQVVFGAPLFSPLCDRVCYA